jgi:hypothetical protein
MKRRSLSQHQSFCFSSKSTLGDEKGISFPETEWPDTPADLAIFWPPTD